MDEIKEVLLEVLGELHPDVNFETEDELVERKIIDSFDIVTIIARIDEEFDVAIPADKIVPEHFNSMEALAQLVSELLDE
ncbi:MAG: acyl carrier protein [Lachnospiraceae bacterium]|nr:acyl carrier protein [Lachnospiraceae bacterium]MBR6157187.1 acyl carrier protein [Lachnospiraceae bacterium]